MSAPEVLQRITTALNQTGITYMLTGSFASAHYGAPRSTQDIDLVIEASPAQRCYGHNWPAGTELVKVKSTFVGIQRPRK